jgi:hypothetical protein
MRENPKIRDERCNGLGYETRHFAHRHRITRAAAEDIINRIGLDRAKLDEAARALKLAGPSERS